MTIPSCRCGATNALLLHDWGSEVPLPRGVHKRTNSLLNSLTFEREAG